MERRLLGSNFLLVLSREYDLRRLQSKQEESTEEEEMKQQQRMAIMKDLIKKIRSKGRWMPRTDGGWTHTGWADTMHKMVRMAGVHVEER